MICRVTVIALFTFCISLIVFTTVVDARDRKRAKANRWTTNNTYYRPRVKRSIPTRRYRPRSWRNRARTRNNRSTSNTGRYRPEIVPPGRGVAKGVTKLLKWGASTVAGQAAITGATKAYEHLNQSNTATYQAPRGRKCGYVQTSNWRGQVTYRRVCR